MGQGKQKKNTGLSLIIQVGQTMYSIHLETSGENAIIKKLCDYYLLKEYLDEWFEKNETCSLVMKNFNEDSVKGQNSHRENQQGKGSIFLLIELKKSTKKIELLQLDKQVCIIKNPIGFNQLRLYLTRWDDDNIFVGSQLDYEQEIVLEFQSVAQKLPSDFDGNDLVCDKRLKTIDIGNSDGFGFVEYNSKNIQRFDCWTTYKNNDNSGGSLLSLSVKTENLNEINSEGGNRQSFAGDLCLSQKTKRISSEEYCGSGNKNRFECEGSGDSTKNVTKENSIGANNEIIRNCKGDLEETPLESHFSEETENYESEEQQIEQEPEDSAGSYHTEDAEIDNLDYQENSDEDYELSNSEIDPYECSSIETSPHRKISLKSSNSSPKNTITSTPMVSYYGQPSFSLLNSKEWLMLDQQSTFPKKVSLKEIEQYKHIPTINKPNDIVYIGRTDKNGLEYGYGFLIKQTGNFFYNKKLEKIDSNKMIYAGYFQNGLYHGTGYLKSKWAYWGIVVYEGNFCEGKKDGWGKLWSQKFDKPFLFYKGQFSNDQKIGFGLRNKPYGLKVKSCWDKFGFIKVNSDVLITDQDGKVKFVGIQKPSKALFGLIFDEKNVVGYMGDVKRIANFHNTKESEVLVRHGVGMAFDACDDNLGNDKSSYFEGSSSAYSDPKKKNYKISKIGDWADNLYIKPISISSSRAFKNRICSISHLKFNIEFF